LNWNITVKRLILALLLLIVAPARLFPAERYDTFEKTVITDIRIVGANHTRERVILRELTTKIGELFDYDKLSKDLQSLDRMGVFSEIKIYPIEEDGETVIMIEVSETFRYFPIADISIDDENGVSAGGGLKSVNLFGKGISCHAVALFGGATTTEAAIRNPWVTGNHFGYDLAYYHRDRRNGLFEFDERADEVFLTLSSFIRQNGRIGGRCSFQAIRSDVPGKTLSDDNIDKVTTAGFFIGYDSRNLISNTSTGWWNELSIEKIGLFGGDIDFWRAHVDIRRFMRVSDRNTIAFFSLTSLTGGTIGEEIAPWQQYSLGGTNSVRGWDLGSRTGKHQFINTLEYRYTLLKPRLIDYFGLSMQVGMHIAAFADVGTAWTQEEDFRKNIIDGYGIGIRFIMPYLGLMRFDFGAGQPDARIQVHIGSYEKPVRQRDRVR
jgi:outer membrane protein assembly factor BamA